MNWTIGEVLARNAAAQPLNTALIDGDTTVSWAQLNGNVNRLASALEGLGFGRGARIATISGNNTTAIELLFAIAAGGQVGIPINYGLTPPELELLFRDSMPEAIVVEAAFVDRFISLLNSSKAKVIVRGARHPLPAGWLDYDAVLNAGRTDYQSPAQPDDIRTIRYTSGTTAAPKGCLGTHRQILSSIANFLDEIPVPPEGPFLQMLPLFSGAGIWMAIAAACHGVANVLMPSFDAARALSLIERHRVAHACGVPTMVRRICDAYEADPRDLSSFKLFGYTGAAMPVAVLRRALQMLPCEFYQGFGGGELGGLVSYLLPDDHRAALADSGLARRLASGGRPAGYAEVVVRDLKTGEPLPRNEAGEITVRSASNFAGYHQRPEDTARTLRGEWVYTGDVGYVDDDGFLFVVDRVKDMVVTGGMNVSSAEVEAALAEHPAVRAAAVIGLPDEEWGEIVTGVVTLRADRTASEAELIAFARGKLAGYKAPKKIVFMDDLPLNSAGKVLKRELREQLKAGRPAAGAAHLTIVKERSMEWKPDSSKGPRGHLVEVEEFKTLEITMPIEGVAQILLNRPEKLNAFDVVMVGEIRAALWRMTYDDRVRVIVITGAGRGFCSGRDVGELQAGRGLPSPHYRAYTRSNHEMLDDIEAIEKPVIAAINGVCAGGGVELAASCDFRFASSAAKFSLPEIFIGVIPASGACSRMIQMIGIENVKDMVMTGRTVDAAEAKEMGFVRRVVEPDRLQAEVLEFAKLLMKGAPLAVGIGKHVTNTCQNIDTDTGRVLERLAQSSLTSSTDSTEGVRSFLEKRPARFTGR